MRLRKCQAIKNGVVQFEGLFHRWADTGSATAAIIEAKDGNVSWWLDDVKFLEPEHPRVEVTPLHKEPRQGEFHGWYQQQDEDGGSPVALVRFDDGTVSEFPVWRVRFLELGAKEDKPIFFRGNLGALLCDREIDGLTQTLDDADGLAYGGKYFVGETILLSAAKLIAEALGGVWRGENHD